VQLGGAVKKYVAAVEASGKGEGRMKLSSPAKLIHFLPIYFSAHGTLPIPNQFRKSKYP
jgi:hypothetical protein